MNGEKSNPVYRWTMTRQSVIDKIVQVEADHLLFYVLRDWFEKVGDVPNVSVASGVTRNTSVFSLLYRDREFRVGEMMGEEHDYSILSRAAGFRRIKFGSGWTQEQNRGALIALLDDMIEEEQE